MNISSIHHPNLIQIKRKQTTQTAIDSDDTSTGRRFTLTDFHISKNHKPTFKSSKPTDI